MTITLFDILNEVPTLLRWLRAGVGWRFLFFEALPAGDCRRWKSMSGWSVAGEIVCGASGVAAALVIFYALIAFYAGWDWMQEAVPVPEQAKDQAPRCPAGIFSANISLIGH